MAVIDSVDTNLSEQLLFDSVLEQAGSLGHALSQDKEILFPPDADVTVSQFDMTALAQQCSEDNEPETIDLREIEGMECITGRSTNSDVSESTKSPTIGGHATVQLSAVPQPVEIPDSQPCDTLSDAALLHSLDEDEVLSNTAEHGASDVSYLAESQMLQRQSGNLASPKSVEPVTDGAQQAAFKSADSNNEREAVRDASNSKDSTPISEQAPSGSSYAQAVHGTREKLYDVDDMTAPLTRGSTLGSALTVQGLISTTSDPKDTGHTSAGQEGFNLPFKEGRGLH